MAPVGGQRPGWHCCLKSRKGLAFLVMPASRYARYVPAQAHQALGAEICSSALAGLPGDSSAGAWWGNRAGGSMERGPHVLC